MLLLQRMWNPKEHLEKYSTCVLDRLWQFKEGARWQHSSFLAISSTSSDLKGKKNRPHITLSPLSHLRIASQTDRRPYLMTTACITWGKVFPYTELMVTIKSDLEIWLMQRVDSPFIIRSALWVAILTYHSVKALYLFTGTLKWRRKDHSAQWGKLRNDLSPFFSQGVTKSSKTGF